MKGAIFPKMFPQVLLGGIKRTFDLNDYKYIVDVARKVGVRFNAVCLCEMDRENVLAKYPRQHNSGKNGIIPGA